MIFYNKFKLAIHIWAENVYVLLIINVEDFHLQPKSFPQHSYTL